MRELFVEIFRGFKKNRLRTVLTGFAVSWGIFMLIALLGAGNGLMNAFMSDGEKFASNTMMVGGGWTSKPYGGLKAGRRIDLEDGDVEFVGGRQFSDHIDGVSATVGKSVTVSRGAKHFSGYIEGNFPDRARMEKFELLSGRFINDNDIRLMRKVVVMPDNVAEFIISGREKPVDMIGREIKVAGISFKVVGITKGDMMRNDNLFYAPYSTVKTIFSRGKSIDDLTFTFHGLETEEENEAFEKSFKASVNMRHGAAPDDERAIWIWNRFTQNMQMDKAGRVISTALWIIGLFTLLGGIVGVGNIMLISVRERTHEFGIRKAIGASPWSIMKMIITESVVVTAIFGYIGMVLGLVACDIMDSTLGSRTVELMGESTKVFVNPTVGLETALGAMIVLIVAGTVAGLMPAVRAAKVRPIEALRTE